MSSKNQKKTKAYEQYTKKFMPKPNYFMNALKAFVVGGMICDFGYLVQSIIQSYGIKEETAATISTVILIAAAQILTGFGVYDKIGKFAGAGSIVPITGFANSIVSPAMEYKKEGLVLGIGSKIFSIAGPVLVYGISASVVIGIIYWLLKLQAF